jgi:hypothetical protein
VCAYVESGVSGGCGGWGVGPKVRTRVLYGVASCVASAILLMRSEDRYWVSNNHRLIITGNTAV